MATRFLRPARERPLTDTYVIPHARIPGQPFVGTEALLKARTNLPVGIGLPNGLVDSAQHGEDMNPAPVFDEISANQAPGDGDTALVRNHIRNLRRKIEVNPNQPDIIISLHGRGYSVNAHIISDNVMV